MLSKLSKLSEEFNVRFVPPDLNVITLIHNKRSQYFSQTKYNVNEMSDI